MMMTWQLLQLPQRMGGQCIVKIDIIEPLPEGNIANGVIYVATYQGHVAAVSLKSGDILWEHAISSYSGLALGQRLLFVSDAQSTVWAFDHERHGNCLRRS